jgi:type II secretory pathway pseudopilin PulG
MLIVLALLGMLAVVLCGSIFLGINARNRVTAVALDHQDFSSFQRIMTLELARAYPDWIENGRYSAVNFDGGPDSLRFMAPALDVQGQGLAYYTLSVSQARGRPAILLRATLSSTNQTPTLETHFAIGLAKIHFEYFGISQDGGAELWQENWTMRTTLPDLVAIQVTFPGGDRRSWPILVVHPDIDADVTCEIDPTTHRCVGR